jgi:hypothetical protein
MRRKRAALPRLHSEKYTTRAAGKGKNIERTEYELRAAPLSAEHRCCARALGDAGCPEGRFGTEHVAFPGAPPRGCAPAGCSSAHDPKCHRGWLCILGARACKGEHHAEDTDRPKPRCSGTIDATPPDPRGTPSDLDATRLTCIVSRWFRRTVAWEHRDRRADLGGTFNVDAGCVNARATGIPLQTR